MMKIVKPENLKHMAHIVDGVVVNVSVWDGESKWVPEEEVLEIPTVEYADEETGETRYRITAGIGWDYVDGEFVDNRPVETFDEE
jgi:hypothetical protein